MSGWAQREAERQGDEVAARREVDTRIRELEARRAAPPVARFEYEVVELEGRRMEPASEWAAALAPYAAAGWRVVSIVGEPREYVRAVLERPTSNGGAA